MNFIVDMNVLYVYTFGEKFANLNEFYNGYERTEQL